jgi:hypothetical protein
MTWQGAVPEYPLLSHLASVQSIHSIHSRRLNMKKNAKDQAPQEGRKPFFARLLEPQELEQAAGGATKKYPSDGDDAVTMKYPSDGDDYVTMKYPSDSDDCAL